MHENLTGKNSAMIFQAFVKNKTKQNKTQNLPLLIRKLLKQSEKSETKREKIQCFDIHNNINTTNTPAVSLSEGETESLTTNQHGIAHWRSDTSQKPHQDLHDV